jgi:hypothetical protein
MSIEQDHIGDAGGPSRGFVWTAMIVGIVGILAASVMGYALVTDDDSGDSGGSSQQVTADGFVVEQPGEVGPDAFTPPVNTGPDQTCNKAALLRELQARPDAYREWGMVLGVPEADIPAYIETLRPFVLTVDTPVTNHGLHDGHAYPRPALLVAGTAVLVDDEFPYDSMVANVVPVTTTTTAPTTTTTVPDAGVPVTRCRCGNPLLPPYGPPTTSTTTTTSTSTTTTTVPMITRGTTTTRGTTPTTTPPTSSPPTSTPPRTIPTKPDVTPVG